MIPQEIPSVFAPKAAWHDIVVTGISKSELRRNNPTLIPSGVFKNVTAAFKWTPFVLLPFQNNDPMTDSR